MSTPSSRRKLRQVTDPSPFRGGLTGILLVALATVAVAAAGAVLTFLALLIAS